MNRRHFLKYAGAGIVSAGVAIGGAAYYLTEKEKVPEQMSTTAISERSSSSPTVTELQTVTRSQTVGSATQTSTTQTGLTVVWESDFKDGTLDGFNPATVDETPGLNCSNYPNNQSDVMVQTVVDKTAPSGYGKTLELSANVRGRPGVYVNAITAHDFKFVDDAVVTAYGYMRKASSEVETIGINLTLNEPGNDRNVERPTGFAWSLNPDNPKYGWLMFMDRDLKIRLVHKIGDDGQWHYFRFSSLYKSNPPARRLREIQIDESSYSVDEDLPRLPSPVQPRRNAVFLEVTNLYTACRPKNVYVGRARWSKVGLLRETL